MTNTTSEMSIIPRWAWILAAVVFAASVAGWGFFAYAVAAPHPGSFVASVLFVALGVFLGALFAGAVLLTGYVNRDAKRRGMNALLWTILVIVIPHGIGFIVYFVVRSPLQSPCPGCGAPASRGARFCAACGSMLGGEGEVGDAQRERMTSASGTP